VLNSYAWGHRIEFSSSQIFFFHAAAMLLSYIIQKITHPKFSFPKVYNHISLYGTIASGTIFDPTSQVCPSTMLVLPIVGNWKVRFGGVQNGTTSMPNLIQIRPAVLELNHVNRQTWPALYAFISYISCKEHIKAKNIILYTAHLVLIRETNFRTSQQRRKT
jgi:hypothetical protein